jgi:hypothetical protein
MATFTVPALTTVRMPMAEMATAAIALAVGATGRTVGDGADDARRHDVPDRASDGGEVVRRGHALARLFRPELVVRQSTAACPVDTGLAARHRPSESHNGASPRERSA